MVSLKPRHLDWVRDYVFHVKPVYSFPSPPFEPNYVHYSYIYLRRVLLPPTLVVSFEASTNSSSAGQCCAAATRVYTYIYSSTIGSRFGSTGSVISTMIPRLTKIIRSGITFVSRNVMLSGVSLLAVSNVNNPVGLVGLPYVMWSAHFFVTHTYRRKR